MANFNTVNIILIDKTELLGKPAVPSQNLEGFFTFFDSDKKNVVSAINITQIKRVDFYEAKN
jgi:hypothetical protein